MLLLALQKQLTEGNLSEKKKKEIREQIRKLEKVMDME